MRFQFLSVYSVVCSLSIKYFASPIRFHFFPILLTNLSRFPKSNNFFSYVIVTYHGFWPFTEFVHCILDTRFSWYCLLNFITSIVYLKFLSEWISLLITFCVVGILKQQLLTANFKMFQAPMNFNVSLLFGGSREVKLKRIHNLLSVVGDLPLPWSCFSQKTIPVSWELLQYVLILVRQPIFFPSLLQVLIWRKWVLNF